MNANAVFIKTEGLSKQYRLGGRRPSTSFRQMLTDRWHALFRPACRAKADDCFWALEDVSLDFREGEIVGVIGRNGAGKSTFLKILSQITEPTRGRVMIGGRVSALLEVGTGFHPELSGRENIYLNGTILGMRKREIDRKFDEIVAFAETEKFLDMPVKHYSSGMTVRLGFAVAAHLEPEILLVDEVLAVGDAQFQKKCLGKIGDVARSGRLVIFVSHNLGAVRSLCPRALLLSEGRVVRDGETSTVISDYLKKGSSNGAERSWDDPFRAPGNERVRFRAIRVFSEGGSGGELPIDRPIMVQVDYEVLRQGMKNLCVNLYLVDSGGNVVLSTSNTPAANAEREEWFYQERPKGFFRSVCTLPADFLNEGTYFISAHLISFGPLVIHGSCEQAVSFRVLDTGSMREPGGGSACPGVVRMRLPWRTEYSATVSSQKG